MDTIYVVQFDLALAEKLKQDLLDQSFLLSAPNYTLFQAKKKELSVTLYTSGKLVVQGKQMREFVECYLEPEILGTFKIGYEHLGIDLTARIGVDESGKGDFFGPLCIAGVVGEGKAIEELVKIGVKDSKRLSDSTILKLATEIRKRCPHHLVQIGPQKYNELYSRFGNLNLLLAWGHATVIESLAAKTGCQRALIDQFAAEHVVETALKKKNMKILLTQRTKGEEDPVVAAASILARAAFVEGIRNLEEKIGEKLPKGANSHVLEVGEKIAKKRGPDFLKSIAKIHFKTYAEILDRLL